MRKRPVGRLILSLALLLAATGCTSYRTFREAQFAESREDWDQAVLKYLDLIEIDPGNVTYKSALLRAKIRASQAHFEKGKRFHQAQVLDRALIEYQQAVQLDPTNQYAQVELEKAQEEIDEQLARRRPDPSLDDLKKKHRGAVPQPPILNPRSKTPISLDFPKPVSTFDIYRALGKAFGINVLFDPNLRDQDIAIELKEVTAEDALEILMRAAGHFYKVVDEHSIIIAADNPQNRRTYEDLVIQTFFLSNAEVKDVLTLLRSLIGAKNLASNEQLNAITIRDTADKVKVAERIIQSIDKAKSEVVIDVELLQISTTKLRELGMSFSENRITQKLDMGGTNVPLRLSDFKFINASNWVFTIPTIFYDFVKTNADGQLLAKPQLRITEGEKANLHIGDKVPIPVTQFNSSPNVGGTAFVPITSFQYQDIGIRIDLEPRVHHNKEVTLKLKVEVSQINGYEQGSGGQRQPIIGTRTIESTIRLKDGETNFLAGLLRTDQVNTESGVPGLSDIPIIGRLFGKTSTDNKRTDVMLTLTPHIIRTPDITEDDLLPIWVGTEQNISFRGGSPRVESEGEGPFDEGGATPEEIQEQIRQRLQQLPREMQPEEEKPEPPPAVGIVPVQGAGPSDSFAPPPPPPPEVKEEPVEPEEEPPSAAARFVPAEAAQLGFVPVALRDADGPAVTLRLVPQAVRVVAGDRFELALEVETAEPVAHLPLELAYDPERLAFEGIEPGEFLGRPGSAQVLADDSHPGTLVIGASRLGDGPGVAGAGVVARLRLRALVAGPARIELVRPRALDEQLAPIAPVSGEPADVVVVRERESPPVRGERPAPPARSR